MSAKELSQALASYAKWTREAQNHEIPRHQRISIDDMDAEMLEAAANSILAMHDALDCLINAAVNVGGLPEYGPITKAKKAMKLAEQSYPATVSG